MSWAQVGDVATTWASTGSETGAFAQGQGSYTTGRNSSRFIGVQSNSDGTGGVDFTYRVYADANRHRFFIENGQPISLRSTNNNPAGSA